MNTPFPRTIPFGPLGPVCRLGLATRGNTRPSEADVHRALDRGVNFLNWCGKPDALSRVVAGLGRRRSEVVICVQFDTSSAHEAERELERILRELNTDHVDILTFYYVESRPEWERIIGPGGALEACARAKEEGKVRLLGVTSHQRPLSAEMARSGVLDALMIRYNAAHRGAEQDVFPTTDVLGMPVIAYTCLRWGTLLRPTPEDPPGWRVPPAPAWYRWVLQHPSVTVALAAPTDGKELDEDLSLLDPWEPLSPEAYADLSAHGDRVRRNAPHFP